MMGCDVVECARHNPKSPGANPFSPNQGRTILGFSFAGAINGCVAEFLHFAWTDGTGDHGGWAFLYRAILAAMGSALAPAIGYRLTRRGETAIYGLVMGSGMAIPTPVPSAFAWAELLRVGFIGISLGLMAGIGAAVLAHLVPWNATKTKAMSDPLNDGL